MNLNVKKSRLLVFFLTTICFSCSKFALLKNESQPAVSAGLNNLNITIAQFLTENNEHDSDLTSLHYFAQAVKRVGLLAKLDSATNYTVIVPSDSAMAVFFRGLGYNDIDSVPTPILKNFVAGNIFKGKVNTFDLNIGETQKYSSLNGDFLYMTRQTSRTDAYLLTINDNDSLSTPAVNVRTQNIDFKNGVVHVVDAFAYYALKKAKSDPVDTSKITIVSDTIPVAQDSYVTYGSSANKNFNTVGNTNTYIWAKNNSSPSSTRSALIQFNAVQPSFEGKIGFAKLYLYNYRNDGDATVEIYKDASTNWDETTVTANNQPAQGPSVISSFSVTQYHLNYYATADITSTYSDALANNEPFINLGIYTQQNVVVGFYSKEYLSGTYASFLVLTSPPQTVITSVKVNNPINVSAQDGYKVLTPSDISATGTTNNDIIYVVKQLPANGFLVFYGIPMQLNSNFTQQDLVNGGIKYLSKGTSNSDQVVLEAKDYQGGYYPDSLTVNFQIQ